MNIPTLKKQHFIIIGAVVVVVIVVFYIFAYKPVNIKIETVSKELKEKEDKLKDIQAKANRLPQLQVELKTLELNVKDAERKLPREKEIPVLLKSISKLAEDFRINILNIAPAGMAAKDYFYEFPFNLSVTANYHNLGLFLSEIGQMERIINTKTLMLGSKSPVPDDPTNVSATFQIVTYTFKEGK